MRWHRNNPAHDDAAANDATRPWWDQAPTAAPEAPTFEAVVAESSDDPAAVPGLAEPQPEPRPRPKKRKKRSRPTITADTVIVIDTAPSPDAAPVEGIETPPATDDAVQAASEQPDVEPAHVEQPDLEPTQVEHPPESAEDPSADDLEDAPRLVDVEPLEADALGPLEPYRRDIADSPEMPQEHAPEDIVDDQAFDEPLVPQVELSISFGERIERIVAAAVTEAANTRADAAAAAEELLSNTRMDAEHIIAVAQREAAEIIASAQHRYDSEVTAAKLTREEADNVLADARREAEELLQRARDEVSELRTEIDQHAQSMLARAHAETSRTLAESRAELESLHARRADLEAQIALIRSQFENITVDPLPVDVESENEVETA